MILFTYLFYLVLDTPLLQRQGLKIHTDLANKSGIITAQTCPLQATVAAGAALLHCARRHSRQASRRRGGEEGGMMHHASKSAVLIYFEVLAAASASAWHGAYIINQSPL